MSKHSGEKERTDDDLCECDRPDRADDPHRHAFDVACVYWLAGRPSRERIVAAVERRLPLIPPGEREGV